jgi:hypothetical protein
VVVVGREVCLVREVVRVIREAAILWFLLLVLLGLLLLFVYESVVDAVV